VKLLRKHSWKGWYLDEAFMFSAECAVTEWWIGKIMLHHYVEFYDGTKKCRQHGIMNVNEICNDVPKGCLWVSGRYEYETSLR